jgi:cysteine desulfurase family protein (TIGR01976 family)
MNTTLNLSAIRSQFPALAQTQNGRPVVFFDAPGGTQCPRVVIDAVSDYLASDNANHGGAFATSVRSDEMLADAHGAVADLLGAASPAEVVFGPNMTTLTFGVSRAIGRELGPGDEIMVTRLDHDANVAPWLLLAEDRGAVVRWVDIHPEDCTLDLESFASQLSARTRLVAVGYASNAVGTINDVGRIVEMAHAAGALAFVDAVQFAPHGSIDVQALGCDFLACSAYKFFGPHVGVLYGRMEHLDRLSAYKVRPAGNRPPDKFETGTQNHEGIAGTRAAIEYLAGLAQASADGASRRSRLVSGIASLREYERRLCRRLLEGLGNVPGLRIWGIADPARVEERVPTVSLTLDGHTPRAIAEHLGGAGIFAWSGHFYAVSLTDRLGLDATGGLLRVGLAHYNTELEVDRLLHELSALSRSASSRRPVHP